MCSLCTCLAEATRPGRVGWTKPRARLFVTSGKEIALRGQCLSLLKSSSGLALTESNFSRVLMLILTLSLLTRSLLTVQ